jgi:hypothetical protein
MAENPIMSSGGDVFDRPSRQTRRWTNSQLDELRKVTDTPADEVIAEFFEQQPPPGNDQQALHPHGLLMTLMNERISAAGSMPARTPITDRLLDELARRSPPPEVQDDEVRAGQELFQFYGPEVLMNLCSFSLPMAYGAAKGAKVLHETGYLENRVQRRLIETTQMVVDVMKPGGLNPGGDGLRTAREVRLMHASIRYLIKVEKPDWKTNTLGEPINQEDMAGTLMTFSYVVLKGLHQLGLKIEREQQEAYLAAWRHVGRSMGLVEELLPGSLEEAQELTWFIFDRQMKGSDEGRALMAALLNTMRGNLPFFARWFAPSVLRVMMIRELADALKVPRNIFWDTLTLLLLRLYAAVNNLLYVDRIGLNPHRWFSQKVIEAVTLMGRGHDVRATFELPEHLHEYWNKPPPKAARRSA